jgi:hypothetical protein
MSYIVYRMIHLLGIFTLLIALAASAIHILRGGTRAGDPHRRTLAIAHGISAFLILLGGFGMLARLGIVHGGLPNWVYAKLTIWLLLSAAFMLVYRSTRFAGSLLIAMPFLALLAAAIAIYKPF